MSIDLENSDQAIGVLSIVMVLFGFLVLPFVLQEIYDINAIKTVFAVIVLYAFLNWYLKSRKHE